MNGYEHFSHNGATTQTFNHAGERELILRARAAELAKPIADDAGLTDLLDLLEFRLAGETYAFNSTLVAEVLALRELAWLPGTPAWVLGIINVRGQIYSVIDLRRFLGLAGDAEQGDSVIIVRSGAMELGIRVDEIIGVRQLAPAAVQPGAGTFAGETAAYFAGVTADRVAILDMAALLADEKLIVNQESDV